MEVVLIRHTSVDVPKYVFYGQTDVPLRSTFEQEACDVQARLSHYTFDKVYTSPLSRCVKLANYCGFSNAERDNRILELNFGDWEMKDCRNINDSNLQAWYDDYANVKTTNGESFSDQYQRVSDFLDELKNKTYQHVAIFAHGGVLACAQIYAGIQTQEEAFEFLTPYGGIVTFQL